MYLLGHVGFTLLVYSIFERNKQEKNLRHKFMIGLGAMLPDFIDKPIGDVIFHKGRWFGHSIIFQFVVFLAITLVVKTHPPYPKLSEDRWYWYAGATMHLLEDMPGLALNVVLWPLLGPVSTGYTGDFLMGFGSPRTWVTEILGLSIIFSLAYIEKWDTRAIKIVLLTVVSYITLFVITFAVLVGF